MTVVELISFLSRFEGNEQASIHDNGDGDFRLAVKGEKSGSVPLKIVPEPQKPDA